ncbi:hypothetical protein ABH926_008165 [Catenulispora sp. GP43]|uniref:DUF2617 family protein n=1 Tax=Catenulispora sp. GP43 TaxID=3156263 RepID=UPI003516AE79
MIAPLSVPYRDVRASELSWSLEAPDQPALHSRRHPVGGLDVEVRILGASHQILVRTADPDAEPARLVCRETVACRDAAGPLPIAVERELDDGYHYEVRCEVRTVDSGHFPAWASALRDYAGTLPDATVAVFPANPDAVTAVVVEPLPSRLHGVLWRTWHTYPHAGGGGDVVATRTVLYLAPPSGGAGGGMPGLRP